MYGQRGQFTGGPTRKATGFLVPAGSALEEALAKRCDGSHEHEQLQGANAKGRRTQQASPWPKSLDQVVLSIVMQRAAIDYECEIEGYTAFPAHLESSRPPTKKQRRRMAAAGAASDEEVPSEQEQPVDDLPPEEGVPNYLDMELPRDVELVAPNTPGEPSPEEQEDE